MVDKEYRNNKKASNYASQVDSLKDNPIKQMQDQYLE